MSYLIKMLGLLWPLITLKKKPLQLRLRAVPTGYQLTKDADLAVIFKPSFLSRLKPTTIMQYGVTKDTDLAAIFFSGFSFRLQNEIFPRFSY